MIAPRTLPASIAVALLTLASLTGCDKPTAPSRPPLNANATGGWRPISTFDGVYSNITTLPGGFTHYELDVVSGLTVNAQHIFSNGTVTGGWNWNGFIILSSTNSNTGTILGAGTRADDCCGAIRFKLDHGDITANADGSAQLNYTATDPRFGAFGGSSFRKTPLTN